MGCEVDGMLLGFRAIVVRLAAPAGSRWLIFLKALGLSMFVFIYRMA